VNRELLGPLEAAGLRVCIDYRDFAPGAAILDEIERAVRSSRKTIFVFSPAYLTSGEERGWTKLEQWVLQTDDPTNNKGRFLALKKEDCELPDWLIPFIYADFGTLVKQENEWERLLKSLMPPFAELLKRYRNKSNFTQKNLAARVGCNARTISLWEKGAKLPGNSNIVLQLLDTLGLSEKEGKNLLLSFEVSSNRPVAPDEPLFSKNDPAYRSAPMREIVEKLREWKGVHSEVQNLLIDVVSFRAKIAALQTTSSESLPWEIENEWFQFCASGVTKTRFVFKSVRSIDSVLFRQFVDFVESDQYIHWHLRNLQVGDDQSFWALKLAVHDLIQQLTEILMVTDMAIVEIAEELKRR
jgi:transcriptional regulator with XRE-family HTH domain